MQQKNRTWVSGKNRYERPRERETEERSRSIKGDSADESRKDKIDETVKDVE